MQGTIIQKKWKAKIFDPHGTFNSVILRNGLRKKKEKLSMRVMTKIQLAWKDKMQGGGNGKELGQEASRIYSGFSI